MKRALVLLLLLVLVAGGLFLALRPKEVRDDAAPVISGALQPARPGTTTSTSPRPAEPPLERLDMAKDLNAPGKTARDDLNTLDGVFLAWQSNFLKDGNPVGDNAEITAALTGKNRLHLAFLAPDHPAINAHGELCDRWGTPYFFHQESGSKMAIISAGPDRKRGTADDVVLTP